MSTLALMRWLESAPERYDAGMRILTLGRARLARELLVTHAVGEHNGRVLEIGCGTGALTERLVERGASVTAIDQNPEMLECARARLRAASDSGRAELLERTACEIDALPGGGFDAVVASFVLSEMSASERRYVLAAAHGCLLSAGVIAIADEVRPTRLWARILYAVVRGPQALLGWLLAGSTSRPLPDLCGELQVAGFRVTLERRWLVGSLAVVVAERQERVGLRTESANA